MSTTDEVLQQQPPVPILIVGKSSAVAARIVEHLAPEFRGMSASLFWNVQDEDAEWTFAKVPHLLRGDINDVADELQSVLQRADVTEEVRAVVVGNAFGLADVERLRALAGAEKVPFAWGQYGPEVLQRSDFEAFIAGQVKSCLLAHGVEPSPLSSRREGGKVGGAGEMWYY